MFPVTRATILFTPDRIFFIVQNVKKNDIRHCKKESLVPIQRSITPQKRKSLHTVHVTRLLQKLCRPRGQSRSTEDNRDDYRGRSWKSQRDSTQQLKVAMVLKAIKLRDDPRRTVTAIFIAIAMILCFIN